MGKSYKTICPSCKGDNFYVTPWNGIGYCFSPDCHYIERNGKVIGRKQRMHSEHITEIRALYYDLARYYHSSLTTEAITFLHQRGITDTTIQEFMIGYCPIGKSPFYKHDIAKEAGIATAHHEAFLGNRITFPYFKNATTVIDIRARSIAKDDELRYKSPFGDAYYRGAIYPYNYHLHNARRIILTEGEIKALLSYQAGIHAIAIPGISTWRSGFTQDENQEVIIVFDTERKLSTQRNIHAAIKRIEQELIHIKIATLPLSDDEDKAEIDTFINEYGAALYRQIINNALDYSTWLKLQQF